MGLGDRSCHTSAYQALFPGVFLPLPATMVTGGREHLFPAYFARGLRSVLSCFSLLHEKEAKVNSLQPTASPEWAPICEAFWLLQRLSPHHWRPRVSSNQVTTYPLVPFLSLWVWEGQDCCGGPAFRVWKFLLEQKLPLDTAPQEYASMWMLGASCPSQGISQMEADLGFLQLLCVVTSQSSISVRTAKILS